MALTSISGHNLDMRRRWLFADQLGPHYLDVPHQRVLLIESKAVFRRRAFHRQKAHLVLSALRHRAAELGDKAVHLTAETYRHALRRLDEPLDVCHPTSRRARDFVRAQPGVAMLPPRGFVTSSEDFTTWADSQRGTMRLENFYRYARRRHRVLMEGDEPTGGRWRVTPAGNVPDLPPPPAPVEDDIDAEVRDDLNRWQAEGIEFVGRDGPRLFPATRREAVDRRDHFIAHRLPFYGARDEAIRATDPWVSHSGLSTSFNLGLLHPLEAVRPAEAAYRAGAAPLSSVEGFVRGILGWRDYIWHLYWYLEAGSPAGLRPGSTRTVPPWFARLDADAVRARCLSDTLAQVRDRGWVHHAQRLMVLANYALHRGWRPSEMVDWFQRSFVDGFEWTMVGNVVGMTPYADPGTMTTKPYAAGGAHLDKISDYCAGCRYDFTKRRGPDACPFTAGYWAFLDRARERLHGNVRMTRALRQLDRIPDLPDVVAQERERGETPP